MSSIASHLQQSIVNALQTAYPGTESSAMVKPSDRIIGYQWDGALALAKKLKSNPRQIATNIISHLTSEYADKCEIGGPGFINIAMNTDTLARDLEKMYGDDRLAIPKKEQPQKIVVEFSSPNVAKELHVGHLRSTIIGEALSRVLEFVGHDVLRLSHVGDWGTQFGMLIHYVTTENIRIDDLNLSELMHIYRAASNRFKEDDAFKTQSRLEVVKLQDKNSDSIRIWNAFCEITRKEVNKIYDQLDITVTERGESFYNDMLQPITDDLLEKGIATIEDGAVIAKVEGYDTPMIVRKSDGGFGYDATDIAEIKQRVETELAHRIIVVVDAGQSLHFDLARQVAINAGYLDTSKSSFEHVGFGLVCGEDGKKYKTRSGDVALLKDLISDGIEKAKNVLAKRNIFDEASIKTLGMGALKYADLRNKRQKDYQFDADKMLSFEGDTAAYLLYSYVRIQSLKDKIGKDIAESPISLNEKAEKELGLHIRRFDEILLTLEQTLEPHHLCSYLHDLAYKFSSFYRDCKVQGSEEEASRLKLCDLTGKVQKKGLELLGISTLDKM